TVTFTRTLEAGTYNITIDGLAPVNVNVTPAGVSLGDLVSAANTVKAYYERYGRLPSRVVIAGQNYTMSQLLYLLTKATVNINMGNLNPIAPRAVGAPTAPGGSYRHGRLYKPEYVQVAANILSFINRYGRAPNYASTSLGRIPFQRLVYMYTKIIAFYGTNHRLPNYVTAVGAPTAPGGSYRHGRLYKPEYVQVAANILSFINRYGRAPNYASTSLGRIPFQRLVYMYTKIIAFYGTNHRLPNYVTI
ncbi:MAG TPA: pseudomurein-binding repeat-containing protein, partial [Methanothermobacter sp.]|nr:pseudomurein-binding repeat-containing protein [Methanothermobacter sp.]HPU37379.1 pseudomurein-binding repeat-containing protein [Methanothermobacter sp.]